jgi:hypothetical protein
MRLISSTWTWWYKKVFPAIWFGFLGIFALAWVPGVIQQKVPTVAIFIPLVMAAFGYILMRVLGFSLVDEVWIENNNLVVRNHGQEDRFLITNISSVRSKWLQNPEHIVLTLKEPCCFGQKVVFSPTFRWLRFGRHPIADELIKLAHEE